MGLLQNLWGRFRKPRVHSRRQRRLFLEPLESRQLLVASLTVSKTDFPDPIDAGSSTPLSYNITITNDGPDDATNVDFSDPLPVNTGFSSFFQGQGNFVFDPLPNPGDSGTIHGTVATMLVGETAQFTLLVNVKSNAPEGILTNTVTVTADNGVASGDLTEDTTITTKANLHVEKTATPASVSPGDKITYSISITDAGPSDARFLLMADDVPTKTTFFSAQQVSGPLLTLITPTQGSTGTVTASATSLPALAQPAIIEIVVQVDAGATGT